MFVIPAKEHTQGSRKKLQEFSTRSTSFTFSSIVSVVEHTTSLGPINTIVWSLCVSSPYSIKDGRAEMVWVHPPRGD